MDTESEPLSAGKSRSLEGEYEPVFNVDSITEKNDCVPIGMYLRAVGCTVRKKQALMKERFSLPLKLFSRLSLCMLLLNVCSALRLNLFTTLCGGQCDQ